jgi:hypothetical protein
MKATIWFSAALSLLLVAGCGGKGTQSRTAETETAKPAAPPSGEGHAEARVVAGSYADWCDEHGVPETQCTRCDPSLVPAFQAAGDWDGEHGLPMSQCKIHNPNLKIVRPPKSEGM